MNIRITNKKGVALIFALIVMTALVSIVGGYLSFVQYSTKNTGTQVSHSQAIYLAEAGLNKAVYYLENTAPDSSTDGSWRTTAYPAAPGPGGTDPQQESFGAGTYTMWVETSGSDVLISARGTANGIERIIQQTVTVGTGIQDYLDQFNAVAYNGDDGAVTWSTSWVETDNNGGGASGGDIRVTGGQIRFYPVTDEDNIYRTVDLSSYTVATVNYDVDNQLEHSQDRVRVQWYDGSRWSDLENYIRTNQGAYSETFDVSADISSDNRIRFLNVSSNGTYPIYFDNVQIEVDLAVVVTPVADSWTEI